MTHIHILLMLVNSGALVIIGMEHLLHTPSGQASDNVLFTLPARSCVLYKLPGNPDTAYTPQSFRHQAGISSKQNGSFQ